MATYLAARENMVLYSLTDYNCTKVDLEKALVPFTSSLGVMNLTLQPIYTQFQLVPTTITLTTTAPSPPVASARPERISLAVGFSCATLSRTSGPPSTREVRC